ncbi:MAG TPA: maltose alpha-D-glucosyltransferase [Chloroflexia bacterium]|nr:maltose alpha-D-glucosyltransferase [Chloroflexia bacterium]
MDDWYKDAIMYELHVKAFHDGNGDGIGDFVGLTQKLDYLQELGIDCIWLLPFFKSPLRDDGYDVADYYEIHPSYGTVADFKAFLKAAHKRGIRVLTDLVLNHTSDQHPWFQEARSSMDPRKRNYYVWSDDPNRYSGTRIIFTDTETSNWTRDPVAGQFFWHRFFSHQPDLNYDYEPVRKAMLKVMRYWLDMGIDGFRCDAVPYLIEREGTNCENLPETHVYLKEVRRSVDERYTGKVLMAEANQWPVDLLPYFGNGDEFHMAFNFPLMPRIFMAVRQEDRTPIMEIVSQLPEIPENCQWSIFLRNHDELTLEMVTGEERAFMYREYAPDPRMKINVGIRRRLAPLLNNDRGQIELLNSLLFTLPGTPIVYYGDELGMGDNIYLKDRDGVRTPMQWNPDRNAGFSDADAARLYAPVITDPVYSYQAVNVEAQLRTPNSLLRWMQRMIALRKQYPVFGRGDITFLHSENSSILAYIREHEGQKMLIVNNLSRHPQAVALSLSPYSGATPIEVSGGTPFPTITADPYHLTLGPHAFYWLDLNKQRS